MSLKQNFKGFKNGDIFCFKNKRYKAVGHDGCDGCCWQHPKGCNAPIATHYFDFCMANNVIFKEL